MSGKDKDMVELLRPVYAGLAMHALLSRQPPKGVFDLQPHAGVAQSAVAYADALLAQLQKPQGGMTNEHE